MYVLYIANKLIKEIFGLNVDKKRISDVAANAYVWAFGFHQVKKSLKSCNTVEIHTLIFIKARKTELLTMICNLASTIYNRIKNVFVVWRTLGRERFMISV